MSALVEIWSMLERRERLRWLALQSVAIGMALATLASVAAAAPFFAAIAAPALIHDNAALAALYRTLSFTKERDFLIALGVVFVATVVFANACSLFGSFAMNRFAYGLGNRFASALFRDYIHRGLALNDASDTATLFNNVVWEINRGTTAIVQSMFVLGANLATATLIFVSLAILEPGMAIGALAFIGGSYAVAYAIVRRRVKRNAHQELRDTTQRTRIANTSFAAIREITLYGSHEVFSRRFDAACQSIARVAAQTQSIAQAPRWILESAALAAVTAVALLAGSTGASRLGQLAFVAFAIARLLPALHQIFQAGVKIRTDQAAFHRIATDLERALSRTYVPACDLNPIWHDHPHPEIRLENVSFQYSAARQAAVRDITLRIPPLTAVGLIGKSGSGKTTLANLLAGLLTPSAGRILIDGMVLDDSNVRAWQSVIGYVPQDVVLLDASIADNIAFGVPATEIDQRRLHRAARRANLHEFIASLPQGYDEQLGEQGMRVSGGQRQRIGIARALYRDASLLILDEPTSSLDATTEADVLATLRSLRLECCILLITHRSHALTLCDQVLELDDGVIVESASARRVLREDVS